jgi:formylglycine-generating enzyme required for sulfatase activity
MRLFLPGATLALLFALTPSPVSAQERKPDETISIPGTAFTFEMVYVPGGRAKLGSPENEPGRKPDEAAVHEVELRPFWMSRNEVTWEAFVKFFENRKAVKVDGITRPSAPYEPPNGAMGTGTHPAVGMRWHGALQYCEWLSKLTGQRFRLPTEAEWEFAARAGSAAAGPAAPDEACWTQANGNGRTHPVGTKKPNAFGLCDLMGNVWEYALEPHTPPEFGPVIRGGGWHTPVAELRFAARQTIKPEWVERDPNRPRSMWWLTDGPFIGFRIVRFVDPAGKKDQEAYFGKIEIVSLKPGDSPKGNVRVVGQVKNGGDRALDELELTLFHVDGSGKPVYEDNKSRPTFTKAYPVLLNSDKPGPHREPLKPGETRTFEIEVPQPLDTEVEIDKVGAKVSALQFSRP